MPKPEQINQAEDSKIPANKDRGENVLLGQFWPSSIFWQNNENESIVFM